MKVCPAGPAAERVRSAAEGGEMGVLTDFVVVDRSDAQRVCESHCPSRDFAGLDAKGIDTVKLGKLHAILRGGELDPSIHQPVCDGGEDGPWVFEVPSDLLRRLTEFSPSELAEAGRKWAAIEEFSPKYDNWRPAAVQQVLGDIAALCRRAVGEGKAVLMWMSL
jgi:hypothetical protein